MRTKHLSAVLAAAALAAISPAAASAQTTTSTVDTSYGNPEREDDDNGFPWGLLGLLGLLGLMPKKRKDNIHVDNRTGTGTGPR